MATATAIPTYSTTKVQNIIEMAQLVKDIANLADDIKEREMLLAERKKRLAEILPADGFKLDNGEGKAIEAKWVDKLTKTLQKALVEQNHGIVIDDNDYKMTPSHYVNVARVKA